MDERSFIQQKRSSWESLSKALERLGTHGPASLSREQLASLGAQYRAVVSDLSFARSQGASDGLVTYLNELAGRAHGALYVARPARLKGIVAFIVRDFPALFRSTFRYALVAALVFFAGCAVGVYLVNVEPAAGRHWTPPQITDPAGASSFIMTNNIRVGIIAFGAGVTAGVLTTYVLFTNGIMLGAVAASLPVLQRPKLWSFVMPHGVIELTAIFICGGAGLMVGSAIIAPGNLRRVDAIKVAAGRALRLFAGTVPFFVIAGVIEGFVSPVAIPPWMKFVFSGLTALGLVLYLGFAGRAPGAATASRAS